MTGQKSYRSAFLKSKQHAILGFATIGLGFVFGHIFPFILGIVGYVLGWLYIPDMPFFKKIVDGQNNEAASQENREKLQEFILKRDRLLSNLAPHLKAKYRDLVGSCEDIERETSTTYILAGAESPDIRIKKLDELMWTYLRLLCMDQSLSSFINSEKKEFIAQQIKELEDSLAFYAKKNEELKASGTPLSERLFQSKSSMLETLKRRLVRINDAIENIELVRAEQERLVEQIKLLRADSFAMQNSELLSQRIDASMEQLESTKKWLSEMDTFKSALDDTMPVFEGRVGYGAKRNGEVPSSINSTNESVIIDDCVKNPSRQRVSIRKTA